MDALTFAKEHIAVNTQSSIRLTAAGKTLYADPLALPDAPGDADYIFITHDHFDHFSPEDIKKAASSETTLIVPEKMKRDAEKLGYPVIAAAPGKAFSLGEIGVLPVAAYNRIKPFHPKMNGWTGYVLTIEGLKVYIAGDTDATKEAEGVFCDIALLPIGGKYTMDAKDAAALTNKLRPAAGIPTHFGSIVGSKTDGDVFAQNVDGAITVIRKLT